ncbi:MAG: GDSL family lipase [Gluconacetobacter diazotrophicus]|nr:GDSL family lipase [Gluconacetobacter diazotrophicus]
MPVKILSAAGVADVQAPAPAPAATLYALASGLPAGDHEATVFKCTEPLVGNATFAGFQLDAGATVLPATLVRRKIEVIGDSISCGYGNEAVSPGGEGFSPATENAWWTYGAIAARAVGADYECIAWSGRKMYPDDTIPTIFDRTLPLDRASHWAGDKEKPDAILVNLGTNDFDAARPPDHAGWVKAYREFVARLRRDAPQAVVYCALGPMLSDGYPAGRPSLTTAREWIREVVKDCNDAGDTRVRFLEFAPQRAADGIGANNHPSVRTHQRMAEKFVEAVRADLRW